MTVLRGFLVVGLALELAAAALEVLDEEVLAAELAAVAEVVEALPGFEVGVVEDVVVGGRLGR